MGIENISRLDERHRIARRLDKAEADRRAMNDREDVKLARLRQAEAREAHDAATRAFNDLWKGIENEFELAEKLANEHDGLHISGSDYDASYVTRCIVTGLPLFEGDRVYVVDNEIARFYIIAEALSLAPGVDGKLTILEGE